MFDWLADIGGLTRAVFIIGQILVTPFSIFELRSVLAELLVRIVPSKKMMTMEDKSQFRKHDFYSKYGDQKQKDPKRKTLLKHLLQA